MLSIRQAQAHDFEDIYPLLELFENADLSKDDWRRLFHGNNNAGEPCYGFILTDADFPVGFLATTFSRRVFRAEEHVLCNISSWVVKPAYRHASLMLLAEAMKLSADVTITNLTPTKAVLEICKKLGFREMDANQRIILPVPSLAAPFRRCSVLSDRSLVRQCANDESRRIIDDHGYPHVHHILIRTPNEDCHLVLNRTHKRVTKRLKLAFGRIHYLSNVDVFVRFRNRIVFTVCWRMRVVGLIVDERYLDGKKVPFSFRRPGKTRAAAYRSNSLSEADIDGLYSELMFMNY